MLPLPPDAIIALCFGLLFSFLFVFIFMRSYPLKAKLLYVVFFEAILLCAMVALLWASNVSIDSGVGTFGKNETVKIGMSVFGFPYAGGAFIYTKGLYSMEKKSGFTFFKLENGYWNEILVECRDCVFKDCVEGRIIEKFYPSAPSQCALVASGFLEWNKLAYFPVEKQCNGVPYPTYDLLPAGEGAYKAEFCYGKAFQFDWDEKTCKSFSGSEPTCAETEFWLG
jgi:hypothetical protein